MAGNGVGCAIIIKAAQPRPKHDGDGQPNRTAGGMHHARAGKVNRTIAQTNGAPQVG